MASEGALRRQLLLADTLWKVVKAMARCHQPQEICCQLYVQIADSCFLIAVFKFLQHE